MTSGTFKAEIISNEKHTKTVKSASRCKTVVTKTTAVISGMILEPGVGKSEGENTTYYTKTLHIMLKHYILY